MTETPIDHETNETDDALSTLEAVDPAGAPKIADAIADSLTRELDRTAVDDRASSEDPS